MNKIWRRVLVIAFGMFAIANAIAQGAPVDLLITNARVVDGKGINR